MLSLVLVATSSATVAPFEPPFAPPLIERAAAPVAPVAERWYGWLNITLGAGAVGLMAVGVAAESPGIAAAGALGLVAAPIIAHGSQGRWIPALALGGVGIVAPMLGGLLGVSVCLVGFDCGDGDTLSSAVLGGALGGTALVIALDAALVAWAPIEEPLALPYFGVEDGEATVGLRARF